MRKLSIWDKLLVVEGMLVMGAFFVVNFAVFTKLFSATWLGLIICLLVTEVIGIILILKNRASERT